jgi:hypothetical protein
MRKFLLIVFVLTSICCFGQKTTQENDDSLTLKRKLFSLSNSSTSNQPVEVTIYSGINPEFNINQSYYSPLLNFYQQNNSVYRFLPDQNLTNQFIISDFNSITTSHIQSNFIGLGGLNLVQANYNFKPVDNVDFSAGIYAAKFNIYNDFLNDGGFNGNLKFQLSDRININLFGQYSITGNHIAISPFIAPIYPHSDFGGSMEIKVNNDWGIMMGAENEYDVFLRKWVTRPFIMPVFYK